MNEQLGLPGIESVDVNGRHNLFFALRPDAATAARIATLARGVFDKYQPGGYLLRPSRYHITLPYLGEHVALPPALVHAAQRAGAAVRMAPFMLSLDLVGSFPNMKVPWWLGLSKRCAMLDSLFKAIAASLGQDLDPNQFHPHLTIVRDAVRQLSWMSVVPITWAVEEFVLIDSHVRPQPKYEVIGRWRLC